MSDFPYAAVPNKLLSLMDRIMTVGIPTKADSTWLRSHGFKSSNDRSSLRVLEFIGFLDSSRQPTQAWVNYRHRGRSKAVLGEAVRQGYSVLYEDLPEAHHSSDDDLKNFFRVHSSAGEQAIARTVNTFKALCSIAEFGPRQNGSRAERESEPKTLDETSSSAAAKPSFSPELNINIQIHISADAEDNQIEKIFSSMATHLFGRDNE